MFLSVTNVSAFTNQQNIFSTFRKIADVLKSFTGKAFRRN
jgi:hypothetical protein